MTSDETVITEGKAKIITSSNIFYNPVQEFNRDMRYLLNCTLSFNTIARFIFNVYFSVVALTVFAEQCKLIGREKRRKRPHSPNNLSTEPPETNVDSLQVSVTY